MTEQPKQEHINNLKVHGVVRSFFRTISLQSADEQIVYSANGNYIQRQYAKVLKDAGYAVDSMAERALNNLQFPDSNVVPVQKQAHLYLFRTTRSFTGMSRTDFFRKIKSAYPDIEFCPPEVGPELRLQYPEQRSREVLRIGMREIMEGATIRGIFLVANIVSAAEEQKRLMIGSSGVHVSHVHNNEFWIFMSKERYDHIDFEDQQELQEQRAQRGVERSSDRRCQKCGIRLGYKNPSNVCRRPKCQRAPQGS